MTIEQAVRPYQQVSPKVVWEIRRCVAKRLFDLLFTLSLLPFLAPLLLFIALAIRLSSKGRVLYVQPRLGRGGKVFKCYKFRTMYTDAEERLQELLTKNRHLQREWAKNQKLKNDPRIFPLGRWLRRTSLDELPQFWNVIKGDLSVVGPRPYMVCQKQELGHLAPKILSIRPGVTGLWQTSGRSRTTFQQRIALDAEYVVKHDLWSDFFLILKTIPQIFFSKHAY
jgi:exopolysaccharide production protein ExoY